MPIADLLNPQVAEFDVIINGTPLPADMHYLISSVVVDDSLAVPGMFSMEIISTADQDDANQWIDDALFSVGNIMEVKLGYGDDIETLIIGEVTALEPEFAFDRLPLLTVRGYDRRHRLQRGRKTRTFLQQKDSDIASKIAREAGLSAATIDSSVTHDYVIQANQTDLDFLHERARRIQYEVVVYDKELSFRPVQNDKSEVLTLTMDDHLLEFSPRLSTAGQVSEVSVRGWNPKERKEIVSQAQAGGEVTMGGKQSGPKMSTAAFGSTTNVVSEQPLMTQAEGDQIATAVLNRKALTLIEGEGLCLGRTDLRAGKVIKIDGVGQRFGGQYYVTTATHLYTSSGGYRTRFQVRRNAS
jgi:Bacteriophage probable baseplate hub protein